MATIVKLSEGVGSLKINKASYIINEAIISKILDSQIDEEISHFIVLESFQNKRGDAISYIRVAFYDKSEKLHETVKIEGRDVPIFVWYKSLSSNCTSAEAVVQTESGDSKNVKIFIPKSSDYKLRVIGGSVSSETNGEIYIHSFGEISNNKISVR